MKRTPLYAAHQELGGRLIEFGGWEMPVQYKGIVQEHLAVRSACGLFDISHMGQVEVTGSGALSWLNTVLTNDLSKLAPGQAQYTLMCNEQGGVIDDLYVYGEGDDRFLLVINASRIAEDVAWLLASCSRAVTVTNLSDQMGAVAVQGPNVIGFIDSCFPGGAVAGRGVDHPTQLKKNEMAIFDFRGKRAVVARTGYTGEDGFEVIVPADVIEVVWRHLLTAGAPFGLVPAGLGARDTLRTEACYPLYGHELDETTTPIEAGLGFFVSLEKGDFTGRSVLAAQKFGGVKKKLAALRMRDKSAPPRPHYSILSPEGQQLGEVTSGTQSPSLGIGIAMGYVPPEFAKPGTRLSIDIRGKPAPAEVVAKPFYRKPLNPT